MCLGGRGTATSYPGIGRNSCGTFGKENATLFHPNCIQIASTVWIASRSSKADPPRIWSSSTCTRRHAGKLKNGATDHGRSAHRWRPRRDVLLSRRNAMIGAALWTRHLFGRRSGKRGCVIRETHVELVRCAIGAVPGKDFAARIPALS